MKTCKIMGNAYDMGFTHGKTFREAIQHSYKEHCNFDASREWLENLIDDIVEKLELHLPDAVEELKGIADGAKMSFREIVLLNNWEDIYAIRNERKESQCTSICFKSTPDGIILGKTTDIEEFQRDDYFMLDVIPEKGNKSLILGKIGTLKCEAGMNEKGLVVGSSSALCVDNSLGDVERMTVLRYVLQYCDNVEQAIDFLSKIKFYRLGLNIIVLDKSGKVLVAEAANIGMVVRETDTDCIYATNTYVTEKMSAAYDYNVWYYENAKARYENLDRMLKDDRFERSIAGMEQVLRNEDGAGAICNHTPNCETFYATIWSPQTGKVWICDGRPCETEFVPRGLEA